MDEIRIPEWAWGFLFGIIVTLYGVAATFKYLPSPMDLVGDVAGECQQAAVNKQQQAKPSQSQTEGSPAGLQNNNTKSAKSDSENQKAIYDCLLAKYTGSLANFTRLLVAVTGVLALFGFWQTMISRSTARRQLRAYISMDGGSIKIISMQGSHFVQGFVNLKNSGQTPARNCRSWVKIEICPAGVPPFDQTSFGKGGSIVGPGIDFNLPVHWPLSAADLTAIRAGTKRIYVWGETDYLDIFGRDRFFKFYQWNGMEIPGKGWVLETADKPQEAN